MTTEEIRGALTYDQLIAMLHAHHEARVLGKALGIETVEAWGMVCPVCRRFVEEATDD